MTYRERRERRATRLREWADKREAKASQAFGSAEAIASGIPFGQPILVGHHSEGRARRDQARIENGMRAGLDNERKAEAMRQRADNIESAAARAIYDDDPDIRERLQAKIAALEAYCDRIKRFNASCKTGKDVSILDDKQKTDYLMLVQYAAFQLGKRGEFPAYALTNARATLRAAQKRLAKLEEQQ